MLLISNVGQPMLNDEVKIPSLFFIQNSVFDILQRPFDKSSVVLKIFLLNQGTVDAEVMTNSPFILFKEKKCC
jgi:hypothetical protein